MSEQLIGITSAQKKLAGFLLREVAACLCRYVYTPFEHDLKVFSELLQEDDYCEDKQKNATSGALFAHQYIAAYERISFTMEELGTFENQFADLFRLKMNAGQIPLHINSIDEFDYDKFEDCILAFLHYDFQPGWPNEYFEASLIIDFRDAGLIEWLDGSYHWTLLMQGMFNYALDFTWDPEELFNRICK